MKRTVALLLAMSCMLCLFVGCGDKKQTASGSSNLTVSVSDDIFSIADVAYLDADGSSIYRVIRPENGELDETTQAGYVFKQMKSALSTSVRNVLDTEDGTDAYEVLIGNTNRAESAQAKDYLIKSVGGRIDDFIICTIGKKIVINAMTADSLKAACSYFAANFVNKDGIKGGIKYTNKTAGSYVDASINGVALGNFKLVRPRFNQSYLVQTEIESSSSLITKNTGYLLKAVDDNLEKTDFEIIVGSSSRDGVEKIENTDEYRITISGGKVFLNGGSTYATAMAVTEFCKMLTAGKPLTDADSVIGSYQQAVAAYDKSTYYTPTWTDDFTESSAGHQTGVDLTKWAWGTDTSAGSNDRLAVRSESSDHLFVNDGMLNFYAAFDANQYYGFKLTTKGKMTFRYGILEMSAILPEGEPFWISLWANSYDPNGNAAFMTEVNVVEMFGNSAWEASNLHGWLKSNMRDYYNTYWEPQGIEEHWSLDATHGSQKRYSLPDGAKFNDCLHTFTYIWSKDECAFACDGNKYFSVNLNENELWAETFSQPIYLILSQATGFETQHETLDDSASYWAESNNFQIDYVHIYQKADGLSEMNFLD